MTVKPKSVMAFVIHGRYGCDNDSFFCPTLMANSQRVPALGAIGPFPAILQESRAFAKPHGVKSAVSPLSCSGQLRGLSREQGSGFKTSFAPGKGPPHGIS